MRRTHDMPADLAIPEAAARLRDGALSSVALTEAHLERIGAQDAGLHAFVAVTASRALEDAAAADAAFARGEVRGLLQGIPYALKDIIDVRGMPTTAGTRLQAGHVADADAAIAARLRQQGAVLLGKLVTYEWAVVGPEDGLHPPAINPWNPLHITGGSSSGCAAAVAGGLLRTSFGSDTGGSIRSPAGYCGVVGLKPGFGRVPTDGVLPLAPSLDHLGPISASVAEAGLSFDAVADTRPGAAPAASRIGRDVAGLRLRYARSFHVGDPEADPDVVDALDEAASLLSLQGAVIEEVDLPDHRLFADCGAVILHHEAYALHAERLRRHETLYGRQVFASLASGALLGAGDRLVADRARRALTQAVEQALDGADALLTANALQPAPPVSEFSGPAPRWTPMRTIALNLTGHPALAVPIGRSRQGRHPAGASAPGLPIGMQIVGCRDAEAVLCQIGAAWEAATDWCLQKPPIRDTRPTTGS